ncbi:transporter, major facilitator family protein [Necator americanus]|uniref:Transporter, major facilitator family protein n=1 Tax=Necator americanus TaxID=51031 RepID=W2TGD9_NECAM|nr:transporter, major facilitator family protein [Necator americanus]ETN80888.1 transporter, major facilitator family protein [Necator americanus]
MDTLQVKIMVDPISRLIFRLQPLTRLVVVLTGAVLIHLTIGTYHTFGNMLPYMASYMRNFTDSSVRIEHFMWVPTFQGCFPFSMVIGGTLALHVGPRAAALIGCTIATSGVALSFWTIKHSFFAFFVTYGLLFGLGQGIAYVIAVATVINWAPEKVGLVSGIVAAGFGISSSVFAPIQTKLINPLNLPSTRDGYFLDKDLLLRVPDVFLTLAGVYAVMQLMGLIVICDPPEKIHSSGLGSISEYINGIRHGRAAIGRQRFSAVLYTRLPREDITTPSCESIVRQRSVSRESNSDDESDLSDVFVNDRAQETSMRPAEMLASSTFYFLFAALFCCSFYANMFYNLYKTFAETFIDDDFFLARAFAIGSTANAIARVGWGYLTDRTSFQTAVSIATCLASSLLFTIPLTKELGRYAFLLWLVGIFICMGATHALFITAAVKCFGNRYKAANYGFLTFSTTCSGIMLSIISQYYLTTVGYTWLFVITAVFPFIGTPFFPGDIIDSSHTARISYIRMSDLYQLGEDG